MQNINLNTLFTTSVKLDRINSIIESQSLHNNASLSYPPHNIIQDSDNKYRIVFALAGFSNEELEVIVENNTLKVKSLNTNQANKEKYIYKGISPFLYMRVYFRKEYCPYIYIHIYIYEGIFPISMKVYCPNV